MDWTWAWHPHPEVWVLAVVLLGGYHVVLRRLGPARIRPGEPVATPLQKASFAAGVVALVVVSEWPVHDLAEGYLYSVHMTQHLVLTLIMPPLLLAGTPAWLFRALVPPAAMRVLRRLARPLVALVIFNVAVVASHWPLMVGWATRYELAHFAQHLVIVASAFIMWLPVLSPVLEIPRLALPGQMLYLFLQSLVPTVPASFLTFGASPLYPIYETFPRVAGISALSDMRTAGLIMKIAGGFVLWAMIAAIFFRWGALERTQGVDALEWSELDRTMSRMELN